MKEESKFVTYDEAFIFLKRNKYAYILLLAVKSVYIWWK